MTTLAPTAIQTAEFTLDGRTYNFTLMPVTPEQADRWLNEDNTRNRGLREKAVQRLVDDINAGRWEFDGSPIRFSDTGELLDGQHRLEAIRRTGVTLHLLIGSGFHVDTQDIMDGVQKRQPGDILAIHGYSDPNALGAVARAVLQWEQGGYTTSLSTPTSAFSPRAVREKVDSDKAIQWATHLGGVHRKHIDATSTAIGLAAWLLRDDVPLAEVYLNSLAEHATKGEGDPRLAVIFKLRQIKERHDRKGRLVAEQTYVLLKGFDAWRKGQTLKRIETIRGGKGIKFPRLP